MVIRGLLYSRGLLNCLLNLVIYLSEVDVSLNSSLSPCRQESEFFIKPERTNIKFKMLFIISHK